MALPDLVTTIARNSAIRSRAIQETEAYIRSRLWALEESAVNELYAIYRDSFERMAGRLRNVAAQYGAGETWSASDLTFRTRTEAALAQIGGELESLNSAAMDATLRASVRGYQAGYYGGAWQLEEGLRNGLPLEIPILPTDAIRAAILEPYVGLTFVDRFLDARNEFERALRRALVESQIEGESIYLAQKRLADALGVEIGRRTAAARAANNAYFYRTELIARTEILRASNNGALAIYERNQDVLRGWQWTATKDERTCFPAGTLITTELGEMPIERIIPGMKVETRSGLKRAISTHRQVYSGKMIFLKAGGYEVTATSDHPFWTLRGWVEAGSLSVGDSLQTVQNQLVKIERIFNFRIGQANNCPALFDQKRILAIIPAWGMPIPAINFQGNLFRQGKIYRIASYFEFLLKGLLKSFQAQADFLFQFVLTAKSAITSQRAKLQSCFRLNPERFSAVAAIPESGRAAAFLRTIAIELFFSSEFFSTSFTSRIQSISQTAAHTTNGITMGYRGPNDKLFFADWTNFSDRRGGPVLLIALTGAILIVFSGSNSFEYLSALNANSLWAFVGSLMIAFGGTVFAARKVRAGKLFAAIGANSLGGHTPIISQVARHYQIVYNLEIEEAHEFYANGLLVHNCPICGALDGQQFRFGGQHLPPPTGSHPRCRCTPTPVLINAALEERIVGKRQTYREWAAARGVTIAQDGGVLYFQRTPPPKSPSADAARAAPHLYPRGA